MFPCHRVHFRRLVFPWTDVSMGNCSYLDTCRHMKTCRYVHYELDDEPDLAGPVATDAAKSRPPVPAYLAVCPAAHMLLLLTSMHSGNCAAP